MLKNSLKFLPFITVFLLLYAFVVIESPEKAGLSAAETAAKADNNKILSYDEKKKIAAEMKKISRALGVKCSYCHSDASRGLRAGDFTLLTKKGKYSAKYMFPVTEHFKTTCDHCHSGYDDYTDAGERAEKDIEDLVAYNRTHKEKRTCNTCHITPLSPVEAPFKHLTEFGKKQP